MVISPDDFLIVAETGEYVWTLDRVKAAWRETYHQFQAALKYGMFKKVILLIGIPASGKSTWLNSHKEPDTLYVDATFSSKMARYPFLGWAGEKGIPIEAIVMDTPIAVCLSRNQCRPINRQVPEDQVINMAVKLQTEMPTTEEGFAKVTHVRDSESSRVASRFLTRCAGWSSVSKPFASSYDRNENSRVEKVAFVDYIGNSTLQSAQHLLKSIAEYLEKIPEFDGYKFTAPEGQIKGGNIGRVWWDGWVVHGRTQVYRLRILCGVKNADSWSDGRSVLTAPFFELGIFKPSGLEPTESKSGRIMPDLVEAKTLLKEFGVSKLLEYLGGPLKGRNPGKPTYAMVKAFLKPIMGWFDIEEENADGLELATRDHGSVGEEQPGMPDIILARKIKQQLIAEYGAAAIDVEIEYVDEWVQVGIRLK